MKGAARASAESRESQASGDPATPLVEVLELLGGETAASRAFLRGAVLGALVGAAIAGASLVRNRTPGQGRRAPRP